MQGVVAERKVGHLGPGVEGLLGIGRKQIKSLFQKGYHVQHFSVIGLLHCVQNE